ncbi:hypothetical protein ACWCWQ_37175 [Streptomyces sp. NPDC001571]
MSDMTPAQIDVEARRIISEALASTSYRDTTEPVPTGAQPVPQPESRIVPQWATGVAVASIGLGAGAVGVGCAIWLAAKGLAAVTLVGVGLALAPFVGVALVVLAVGTALNRAKSGTAKHIYEGTVVKRTEVHSTSRGFLSRGSRTEVNQ